MPRTYDSNMTFNDQKLSPFFCTPIIFRLPLFFVWELRTDICRARNVWFILKEFSGPWGTSKFDFQQKHQDPLWDEHNGLLLHLGKTLTRYHSGAMAVALGWSLCFNGRTPRGMMHPCTPSIIFEWTESWLAVSQFFMCKRIRTICCSLHFDVYIRKYLFSLIFILIWGSHL